MTTLPRTITHFVVDIVIGQNLILREPWDGAKEEKQQGNISVGLSP